MQTRNRCQPGARRAIQPAPAGAVEASAVRLAEAKPSRKVGASANRTPISVPGQAVPKPIAGGDSNMQPVCLDKISG